jgi:hypothetical protein
MFRMADGAYSIPIHNHGPVDGEQFQREFQQRQAARRKAIQAERKRTRDAEKAGKPIPPQELGPLW